MIDDKEVKKPGDVKQDIKDLDELSDKDLEKAAGANSCEDSNPYTWIIKH